MADVNVVDEVGRAVFEGESDVDEERDGILEEGLDGGTKGVRSGE